MSLKYILGERETFNWFVREQKTREIISITTNLKVIKIEKWHENSEEPMVWYCDLSLISLPFI